LVRADAENKDLFRTWVEEKWNDSGTLSSKLDGATQNPAGILGLLEFVGKMKPDVIYIVGDGSFERGKSEQNEPVKWDAVSKAVDAMSRGGKKVALSFIAFAPDEADARQMKKLAKSSGGRFSVIGKKSG
jgi:hypothetical protein